MHMALFRIMAVIILPYRIGLMCNFIYGRIMNHPLACMICN